MHHSTSLCFPFLPTFSFPLLNLPEEGTRQGLSSVLPFPVVWKAFPARMQNTSPCHLGAGGLSTFRDGESGEQTVYDGDGGNYAGGSTDSGGALA